MEPPLHLPFSPTELAYASSISLPDTPVRNRRYHGSSTDTTPNPTNDRYRIIETDHRVGGPVLCECPTYDDYSTLNTGGEVSTLGISSRDQIPKDAWSVYDLCHRLGLSHPRLVGAHVSRQRSVYDPHGESVKMVRVLIHREAYEKDQASKEEKDRRSWADLARTLLDVLWDEMGLLDFSVEISDAQFMQREAVFPCKSFDAIYKVWTTVAEEILERIGDLTGIFSLACFRVGGHVYTRDQWWEYQVDADCERSPPTVVLGADRLESRDWREVRDIIVSILDARGLTSVAVLIRKDAEAQPGKVVENICQDRYPFPYGAAVGDCRPDPRLGTSINLSSAAGDTPRGTLGAWVELRHPVSGKWVPMVLTSSHCCFPSGEGLSDADLQVLDKWKRDGVHINDAHKSRLLAVDSPSRKDIEDRIEFLALDIKRAEKRLSEDRDYYEKREAERLTRNKTDRDTLLKYLENNNHIFGKVIASSGPRIAPSKEDADKLSIRDWALVLPNEKHSCGENDIQHRSTLKTDGKPWIHFSPDLPLTHDMHTVGRNNDIMTGTYAGLKVCLIHASQTSPTTPASKRENQQEPQETQARPMITWEHAFIRQTRSYMQTRDSGSIVFDMIAGVVGVVFGASASHDVVYFMGTVDLLADIERVTGTKDVKFLGEEFLWYE
ncbi:hypothetical protein BJX64DRAFT_291231 [Aspergillus heterothallicus]